MKDFLKKVGNTIKDLFVSLFNGVKKAPWIVAPLIFAVATLIMVLRCKLYASVINAEISAIDHYALVVDGSVCFSVSFIASIIAVVASVFVCSHNTEVRKAAGYVAIVFLCLSFITGMMMTSTIATALANIKNKLSDKALLVEPYVTKYTSIYQVLCLITSVVTAILIDLAASQEFARKTLVKVKRQPSIIPLIMLAVCSCLFLFNLRHISNSNKMNHMGLLGFISTLLSILVLVPMLNSYPRREKPNVFMIVLTYVMIAGIIVSDLVYRDKLINALIIDPSYLQGASGPSMLKAKDMLLTHVILLAITAVLNATMPLYKKLLNKINTSIELEYTDTSTAVELADE